MSMDTEEMIRAQPVDACIMIGGVFSFTCMIFWLMGVKAVIK